MLVDSGVFTVKHEKIMICFLICEYFHQKYWPGKVVLEFDEWIKWSGEKHLQLRLQNNFWSPQRLCTTCFNCNPIFQCRSNRILNPLNWTTHMSHPNFFMNKKPSPSDSSMQCLGTTGVALLPNCLINQFEIIFVNRILGMCVGRHSSF